MPSGHCLNPRKSHLALCIWPVLLADQLMNFIFMHSLAQYCANLPLHTPLASEWCLGKWCKRHLFPPIVSHCFSVEQAMDAIAPWLGIVSATMGFFCVRGFNVPAVWSGAALYACVTSKRSIVPSCSRCTLPQAQSQTSQWQTDSHATERPGRATAAHSKQHVSALPFPSYFLITPLDY